MGGIVTVIRRQKQHPLWYHTFLFWVSSLSRRCRWKRQVVTGILRPCLRRFIQIQDVCALRVAKGSDSVLAVRERFRIFPQPSKLLTALMWCLGWPMGWPRFYGGWPWPPPVCKSKASTGKNNIWLGDRGFTLIRIIKISIPRVWILIQHSH